MQPTICVSSFLLAEVFKDLRSYPVIVIRHGCMSTTSQKYVDIDLVVFIISETGGSAPCIKAFCAHMLNAVLVATLAVLLKACTCSNHFNRSFLIQDVLQIAYVARSSCLSSIRMGSCITLSSLVRAHFVLMIIKV